MFNLRNIRYLIGGGWNTLFGYAVGIALYNLLSNNIHVLVISAITNIVAISMTFITYKVFVFQTKGNWGKEYFRIYLIYGNITLISMIMLWLMVDLLKIQFWIAQGFVIVITIIISYISNMHYIFSNNHKD